MENNKSKPKINRNVLCAGCGKPIRNGEPFHKYVSMMGRPTTYLHRGEECWKLHYNKWRKMMEPKKFDRWIEDIWADPFSAELAAREDLLGDWARWSNRVSDALVLLPSEQFGKKCRHRRDRGERFAECALDLNDCMVELCPFSPYTRCWGRPIAVSK